MSKAAEMLEQTVRAYEQGDFDGPKPQEVYEAIKAVLEERHLLLETCELALSQLDFIAVDASTYPMTHTRQMLREALEKVGVS